MPAEKSKKLRLEERLLLEGKLREAIAQKQRCASARDRQATRIANANKKLTPYQQYRDAVSKCEDYVAKNLPKMLVGKTSSGYNDGDVRETVLFTLASARENLDRLVAERADEVAKATKLREYLTKEFDKASADVDEYEAALDADAAARQAAQV